MHSLLFFVVALAILIVVHEFGHFWVARRCGVRVLKFSIGFGQPLWRKIAQDGTEYIVAAIPLGGYVKMLDEREGEVAHDQLKYAFNRQSLAKRTAIVAAGPAANLIFAIIAYWVIFASGVPGIRSIIGDIADDSPAAYAQFKTGDEIKAINGNTTPTWSSVNKELAKISQTGGFADITISLGEIDIQRQIEIKKMGVEQRAKTPIFTQLGFSPVNIPLKPVLGMIVTGSAAEKAGLKVGDELYSFENERVATWDLWVELIRAHPDATMNVTVIRAGEHVTLAITPIKTVENSGRIGAGVDANKTQIPEEFQAELQYGVFPALSTAIIATWDDIQTIFSSIAGMLIGRVSSENIGGPIMIAQVAGASAEQGIIAFIGLLAVLSVNLGILNLLPIPVLDGGHLVMHLIEWIRGRPLSKEMQLQGQKVGIILLLFLMFLAFFNDLSRLFGS